MRRTWAILPAIVIAAATLATEGVASASTAAKPTITAKPVAIYAPTSLCPGSSHPTSTVITGTTSAAGGFTATINNIAQPDGYYPVKATAGKSSATTWVSTNGYTCVTG